MSISPRSAAVFIIDCSKTMGVTKTITIGEGSNSITRDTTSLDVMVNYVKNKVAQTMMRNLKTTPIGVLTFATRKTKNIVTTRQKDELKSRYDKTQDPYRGIAEVIPFSFTPDGEMLDKLDAIEAGTGLDATTGATDVSDLLNAIIVATKTLDQQPTCTNYATKDVILLTDGEGKTNWTDWKSATKDMIDQNISLTVIGMDFDPEGEDQIQTKSSTKLKNEIKLQQMVEYLDESNVPSIFASAKQAMNSITEPYIQTVRPTITKAQLTIGDPERGDRSLIMHIDVKKSIAVASVKSMKQMSMKHFKQDIKKSNIQRSNQPTNQSQYNQSQSQSQSHTYQQSQSQSQNGPANSVASTSQLPASQPSQPSQPYRPNVPQSEFARTFNLSNLGQTYEEYLAASSLIPVAAEGIDDDMMTRGLNRATEYFYTKPAREKKIVNLLLDDASTVEKEEEDESDDEDAVQFIPVEESDISKLVNGYLYGGSLVPFSLFENGTGSLTGNKQGMTVLSFLKKSKVRFEYCVGDLLDVTASPGQTGSQLLLSSFINAMIEKKCVAIARWVGKGATYNGTFKFPDPRIGILWPCVEIEGHEFCYWAQMPFCEDVKELTFSSLDYVKKKGMMITEDHRYLPTPELEDVMESFIDQMDVEEDGEPDEEGNPTPFFSTDVAFSPAIHNVKNTLIARLISPGPLPPVPASLTRYANPPPSAIARASDVRAQLATVAATQKVPPKAKKIGKDKKAINYITPDVQAQNEIIQASIFNDFGGEDPATQSGSLPGTGRKMNEGNSDSKPIYTSGKQSGMDTDSEGETQSDEE